jgi:cytochrome bd-type quinol oxidase subunit 2
VILTTRCAEEQAFSGEKWPDGQDEVRRYNEARLEVHGQRAIRLKGGVRMAGLTVLFGGSLIFLGVGSFATAYFARGEVAFTALIPAAIGAVLAVLGALSFKESRRKHTMHAAAALAALTFFLCIVMAAPALPLLIANGRVMKTSANGEVRDATLAVISQAVTAAITLVFVLLCLRSFVQARRNRAKAETAEQAM